MRSNGRDILKVNGDGLPDSLRKFMLNHFAEMDRPIDLSTPHPPDIHPTRPPDIHSDPIVNAVKALVDAGMPRDLIADAVSLIGGKKPVCPPDIHPTSTRHDPSEARRRWDREYRRRKRAAVKTSTPHPPDTADSQNVDTLKEIKIDTEEEVKERKKVRTSIVYSKDFDNFWLSYPRTPSMGKFEAFTVWKKIGPEERQLALAAVPKFSAWVKTQKPDYVILHACRFLSKKRFEGFQAEPQSKIGRLDIPPWEREGLTEADYWEKERGLSNGKG